MTHTDRAALIEAFKRKFKRATLNECDYAIRDIHDTLRLHPNDMDNEYTQKLFFELDAVRERQHQLSSQRRAEHESRRHTAASGQPLDTEE